VEGILVRCKGYNKKHLCLFQYRRWEDRSGCVGKDGAPIGARIGKGTIENLANVISQHTDPKVHPRLTVKKFDGRDIIIIEVKQSPHKPVLADGIPYARVGSSSLKMSKDDHESLVLEKHKDRLQFDKQICKEAKLGDIDWGFVKKDLFRYMRKLPRKNLRVLRRMC